MKRRALVVVVLSASSLAAAEVEPELLALCRSPDPQARRACLKQIGKAGDDRPEVRQMVAIMATSDPAVTDEANETLRVMRRPAPVERDGEGDGDPTRAVVSPTAFQRATGELAVNAYELGTYHLEYGVAPSVSVGVQTAIPIGFFPVGATVKASLAFDGGAVGVWGNGIGIFPFTDEEDPVWLIGGGVMLTLGNPRTYATVGALYYHVEADDTSGSILLPYVNVSTRISSRVRFNAEVWAPVELAEGEASLDFGKAAVVMWGIRVFGKDVWGDIALIDPICAGCSDIYRVIPLGIPFLNIGFRI